MSPLPIVWPMLDEGGPIRVTQYRFTNAAGFTGLTYDLTLNNSLEADYFAMIGVGWSGSVVDCGLVRVTQDPFGTGALGVSSGPDVIRLTRASSCIASPWGGTVTIVENLSPGTSGFSLHDVLDVNLPAAPGSSPQDVTATTSWTDMAQVVPFGGPWGGGGNVGNSQGHNSHDAHARIWLTEPGGTATVNFRRRGQTPGSLQSVDHTVYVVEFGADWTVQAADVTGTNAGDGINATGEYNTAAITSVTRANTWTWGTGTTDADMGVFDDIMPGSAACLVYTLGDGVTQNASESSVAVGQEVNDGTGLDCTVYTLTHPELAVDYRFKADADSANPFSQTVDAAIGTETYDTASDPKTVEGRRAATVYVSSDDTADNWGRLFHWPVYTSATNVDLYRLEAGQSWVGWVQSVDFWDVGLGG